MTEPDVQRLLGPPSAEKEYSASTVGTERFRVAYYYRGLGRVVFAGGRGWSRTGRVEHVEYDPNEPGRAR